MKTPRSIPRNNGVSLLGISLWIVYNDDLPEMNTKYSKLLLAIYSTPSPHHAMPRIFPCLATHQKHDWRGCSPDSARSPPPGRVEGGILRSKKRYCYVLFIVNSKLSKTNFPHLWAFSIQSPSYHPFTTASLILTRLKTFHKYCI